MIENDPQSQEPDGRQPRGKPDWFNRRVIATAVVTFMVVSLFGLVLTVIRHLGGAARDNPPPVKLQCKNNLKQLGIALVQYIDERGGGRYYPYPVGRPGVPDDYSGKEFLAMIWWTDLVSEAGIFLCPSSTDDNRSGADLGVRDGQYLATDRGGIGQISTATPAEVPKPRWAKYDPKNNHYISYASKGWKVSYTPGTGKREALIDEFPSDTIIASDDTVDPPNHRGGFCVLYADSHVDFLSDRKLIVTEENGAVGRVPPLDMICN